MFAVCRPSTGRAALALLAGLLFLQGCSQQPVKPASPPDQAWSQRLVQLQKNRDWDLNGRIAVRLDRDGGSASLQWQQRQENYSIRIVGPFGKGSVHLSGGPDGVSMEDDKGQTHRAADPESLMLTALGWQVPLSGLRHWIMGIPDPQQALEQLQLDDAGRATQISQAGWDISLDRYRRFGSLELPARIELVTKQLKVKLLIKQWDLSS